MLSSPINPPKFAEFTNKIIDIYAEGKVFEIKSNVKPSLETSIRQVLQTQEGREMLYSQLGPLE